MDDVLDAVVIGRACRNSTNIKNRQPISKMFIKADWKLDEFYTAIIADELNVKEVEYTDDVRAFTSYSFKPQMRLSDLSTESFLMQSEQLLQRLTVTQLWISLTSQEASS